MTDGELIQELKNLGIDAANFRALLVLPLIQVAWADGRLQDEERALVREAAHRHGLGEGEGAALLSRWLERRPSDATFLRARTLLLALMHRREGLGSEVGQDVSAGILDACEKIARSAGGLFGIAFRVHPDEREAMQEIAEGLCLGPEVTWDQLSNFDG